MILALGILRTIYQLFSKKFHLCVKQVLLIFNGVTLWISDPKPIYPIMRTREQSAIWFLSTRSIKSSVLFPFSKTKRKKGDQRIKRKKEKQAQITKLYGINDTHIQNAQIQNATFSLSQSWLHGGSLAIVASVRAGACARASALAFARNRASTIKPSRRGIMRDYTNEPATPTAKLKVLLFSLSLPLSLSICLSLSVEQKRKQKEFRSHDITRRGEHYFPFTVHLPSSDIARDFQRQRTTRSNRESTNRAKAAAAATAAAASTHHHHRRATSRTSSISSAYSYTYHIFIRGAHEPRMILQDLLSALRASQRSLTSIVFHRAPPLPLPPSLPARRTCMYTYVCSDSFERRTKRTCTATNEERSVREIRKCDIFRQQHKYHTLHTFHKSNE